MDIRKCLFHLTQGITDIRLIVGGLRQTPLKISFLGHHVDCAIRLPQSIVRFTNYYIIRCLSVLDHLIESAVKI